MKRGMGGVLLVALAAISSAESRWIAEGFLGKAIVPFLGSEDPRTCWGLGVGLETTPPPIFRVRGSKMIFMGYYHGSHSPGASQQPPNTTSALGVYGVLRIPTNKDDNPTKLYVDLGWGFNLANKRTVDLSSRLSSTPIIGFAVGFRQPAEREIIWGVRLMHLSNAGFEGNNQGQNQIQTFVQYRF